MTKKIKKERKKDCLKYSKGKKERIERKEERKKGREKKNKNLKGHPLLKREKCGRISGMWNPGEP